MHWQTFLRRWSTTRFVDRIDRVSSRTRTMRIPSENEAQLKDDGSNEEDPHWVQKATIWSNGHVDNGMRIRCSLAIQMVFMVTVVVIRVKLLRCTVYVLLPRYFPQVVCSRFHNLPSSAGSWQ